MTARRVIGPFGAELDQLLQAKRARGKESAFNGRLIGGYGRVWAVMATWTHDLVSSPVSDKLATEENWPPL